VPCALICLWLGASRKVQSDNEWARPLEVRALLCDKAYPLLGGVEI
jgi:hypothetical protein